MGTKGKKQAVMAKNHTKEMEALHAPSHLFEAKYSSAFPESHEAKLAKQPPQRPSFHPDAYRVSPSPNTHHYPSYESAYSPDTNHADSKYRGDSVVNPLDCNNEWNESVAKHTEYDYNDSDEEGADEYRKGGYHPVKVGEIYDNRYRIEAKLGWGHFSTVWLATDLKCTPMSYVAIKFQKSASNNFQAAIAEIELLKFVNEAWKSETYEQSKSLYKVLMLSSYSEKVGVVGLIDHFFHIGPFGKHACLVFDLMGPNILTLMKNYNLKGIPLNLVRKVAVHVLVGLDFLHRACNIIHTDVKPENIVVSPKWLPPPRERSVSVNASNNTHKAAMVTNTNVSNKDTKTNWDAIEWDKLDPEERKRLKRKKKKQMKKQRQKQKVAAAATTASANSLVKVSTDFERDDKGDAPMESLSTYNSGYVSGNQTNTSELLAPDSISHSPDNAASSIVLHDNIHSVLDQEAKGALNTPPYVKHMLRPSLSDPSLLTTYKNQYAVKEAFSRLPYHHLANNSAVLRECGFLNDKEVNKGDMHGEGEASMYYMNNSSYYKETTPFQGSWDTSNSKKKAANEVHVLTSEGPVCIRPAGFDVFFDDAAQFKICDLGNACLDSHHYYDSIQTRQYRSPEVIIQNGYGKSADIWSFACMVFEMVTGVYLFDPQETEQYDRDEDHLALIIEYLGNFPMHMIKKGGLSNKFFVPGTKRLQRIPELNRYRIKDILIENHDLPVNEALALADFLSTMLQIDPSKRPTAKAMLSHPWLWMVTEDSDILFKDEEAVKNGLVVSEGAFVVDASIGKEGMVSKATDSVEVLPNQSFGDNYAEPFTIEGGYRYLPPASYNIMPSMSHLASSTEGGGVGNGYLSASYSPPLHDHYEESGVRLSKPLVEFYDCENPSEGSGVIHTHLPKHSKRNDGMMLVRSISDPACYGMDSDVVPLPEAMLFEAQSTEMQEGAYVLRNEFTAPDTPQKVSIKYAYEDWWEERPYLTVQKDQRLLRPYSFVPPIPQEDLYYVGKEGEMYRAAPIPCSRFSDSAVVPTSSQFEKPRIDYYTDSSDPHTFLDEAIIEEASNGGLSSVDIYVQELYGANNVPTVSSVAPDNNSAYAAPSASHAYSSWKASSSRHNDEGTRSLLVYANATTSEEIYALNGDGHEASKKDLSIPKPRLATAAYSTSVNPHLSLKRLQPPQEGYGCDVFDHTAHYHCEEVDELFQDVLYEG